MAGAPHPFPTGILVTGSVAFLVALVAGFFGAIAIAVGPCGGDGGSPYASEGSPRAALCAHEDALSGVVFMGPPLLIAVGTVVALVRRRWWPLAVGAGLAVLAFAVPLTMLSDASTEVAPAGTAAAETAPPATPPAPATPPQARTASWRAR